MRHLLGSSFAAGGYCEKATVWKAVAMSSIIGLDDLDSTRKRVLTVLTILVMLDVATSLFILDDKPELETIDSRTVVTDFEVMLSTGSAAGLGLLVALKQGNKGLHGKTYAALGLGLLMWSAGEILWVYYEVFLQEELPNTSMADVFWIIGYGFIGYHLFKNYRYFGSTVNRKLAITMGALVAAAIAIIIGETISIAQIGSNDVSTAIVRISYGIGDFIIIYPALLLAITLRKAKLHFSPWFFITIGLLLTASADVIFAFISIIELIEVEWISNLLYDAANMAIAGGLYWYYKHIVSFGNKAKLQSNPKVSPPNLVKNARPNSDR